MIDAAICLSLDKRKHLIPALAEQVKDLFSIEMQTFGVGEGEDPNFKYDWVDKNSRPLHGINPGCQWNYGTGISSIRHYRAHISHKFIIDQARSKGYKNFLLLEDDAVFLSRAKSVLESLEFIPEFDLIYLGWHAWQYENDKAVGQNISIEKNWEKTGKTYLLHVGQINGFKFNIGGFHAVIINESAYEKLLNMPCREPLDSMVNQNYQDFNRFIIIPKIVGDPCGWSYCDNREVKR
jgi:hypothetical protein